MRERKTKRGKVHKMERYVWEIDTVETDVDI